MPNFLFMDYMCLSDMWVQVHMWKSGVCSFHFAAEGPPYIFCTLYSRLAWENKYSCTPLHKLSIQAVRLELQVLLAAKSSHQTDKILFINHANNMCCYCIGEKARELAVTYRSQRTTFRNCFFHPGPKDQIQVARLVYLYLLSHLTGPQK